MSKPLVNLHIVGVQKAGTSALAHFLSQHPKICVVEGKEAHVFDQPDFPTDNSHSYASKRYEKKLSHYNHEPIICDATPITVFDPIFLKRCYAYNPGAKFILLLRNPVERAVSHFYMSKNRAREQNNMFMSFLKESKRLKHLSGNDAWASGSLWRDNSYLTRGLYKKQIENLFSVAPKDQCLIITQEELLNSHEKTLTDVFKFLNVDDFAIEAEKVFISPKTKKDPTERAARLFAALYFLSKGEYPFRY